VITRRLVERLHHLSQEVSRRTGEAMICVPWRWDSSSSPADLGDNDVVIGRLVARCAEGAYIGGELDDESGEWRHIAVRLERLGAPANRRRLHDPLRRALDPSLESRISPKLRRAKACVHEVGST
jgi:hypothetical protein